MDHLLLSKTEIVQMVMPNWAMDGPFDSSSRKGRLFRFVTQSRLHPLITYGRLLHGRMMCEHAMCGRVMSNHQKDQSFQVPTNGNLSQTNDPDHHLCFLSLSINST